MKNYILANYEKTWLSDSWAMKKRIDFLYNVRKVFYIFNTYDQSLIFLNFKTYLILLDIHVTRFGDLLDFRQVFKASGNN